VKKLLYTGTALGLMASINSYISARTPAIESVIEGEDKCYKWKYGDIFYKVKGRGKNILLLHGIYPGASSFEWRKNFSPLAEYFRVYAIDFIGFGKSGKLKRGYRANLYVKLIFEFLEDIIEGDCLLISSSLSCAYAVKNASLNQSKIPELVLICPEPWDSRKKSELVQLLTYQLLSVPVIGTSLYNTITSKLITRYRLERETYSNREFVTRDMINQYHICSHQKGAGYFFPSLITGLLDLNVTEDFRALKQNIWLCLGKDIKIPPTRTVEKLVKLNRNVKYKLFDNAGLLPHNEKADEFNKFIKKIWHNTEI